MIAFLLKSRGERAPFRAARVVFPLGGGEIIEGTGGMFEKGNGRGKGRRPFGEGPGEENEYEREEGEYLRVVA